ncbi:MAG TPA: hypothetical protein VIT43_00730 [Candidatus Dormibacteraeota bacterium]
MRASRHREVDSKSNEITAGPELLDTLHLDAMGCQKDDTLPESRITNGRWTERLRRKGRRGMDAERLGVFFEWAGVDL